MITAAYNQLKSLYGFKVVKALIVPTHEINLRKKHNGMVPANSKLRKEIIDISIRSYLESEDSQRIVEQLMSNVSDSNEEGIIQLQRWVVPYYGTINSKENEGLGKATKDIVKLIKIHYEKESENNSIQAPNFTIITLMGIDNLSNAVNIAQMSYQNPLQKIALIFNRKEHFEKYRNTESQVQQDPILSKTILFVRDEENIESEVSSTIIRKLINDKQYEGSIQTMLDQDVIKFHVDNNISYAQIKSQGKPSQELEGVKIEDLLDPSTVNIIPYDQLTQIKDWSVILGRGVQGVVEHMLYESKDSETGLTKQIEVAVKKIKFNQQRKRRLDTFQREVRALSAIKHECCVKLYGVGAQGNFVYTVMEMCKDGQSGWDYTQSNHHNFKEKFPKELLISFADLAMASDDMSSNGILHRDFTLNNLLVFEDQENSRPIFKICDFGVSATDEDKHLIPRGKCRNYSPEALEDKNNYCPASDLYMLGIIMWEMLHNHYVWDQFTTEAAGKEICKGELPEWEADYAPEELRKIIYGCIAFDKKDRPTFKELAVQLRELYEAL
eukprot:403356670